VWGKGSSVMEDARVRRAGSFGAGAAAYERGRPGYPVEALRACLPEHARRVLDLGAGTGKLTRGLLDLGLDVAAVEPLEEMRALIPSAAQTLAGSAEAVPLPDACVDAVLVGQAFHWFDHDRALAEIARVLSPARRSACCGTFSMTPCRGSLPWPTHSVPRIEPASRPAPHRRGPGSAGSQIPSDC